MRTDGVSLTARDVASSNQTLNTLMGGRQKSWMTGSNDNTAAARLPPRVQQPQRTTQIQIPPQSVFPSPAPSNEPSPLAQESPVRDAQHYGNTRPAHSTPARLDIPLSTIPPTAASFAPQMIPVSGTQSPTIPQSRNNSIPTPTTYSPNTPGNAPQQGQPWFQPATNQAQVLTNQGQVWVLSNPPQTQQHAPLSANPPWTSSQIPQNQMAQNPPGRNRVREPNMSLKPHVNIIDTHVMESGGMPKLSKTLEQPRFTLLRDACTNDDQFFVALHQVFCVWTLNPSVLEGIDGFSSIDLHAAFHVLGQLIKDNSQINLKHLQFFCSFPSPLMHLIAWSAQYRARVQEVSQFLKKLPTEWPKFNVHCQQRGFPPLVDELISYLSLLSPIVQGVVFTATRRNLDFLDDEFGNQMERLFAEDRDGHAVFARRMNTDRPPCDKEVDDRNTRLVNSYRAIWARRQHNLTLAGQGNAVPRPQVPSQSSSSRSVQQGSNNTAQAINMTQQPISPSSYNGPVQSPHTASVPQFVSTNDGAFQSQTHSPQALQGPLSATHSRQNSLTTPSLSANMPETVSSLQMVTPLQRQQPLQHMHGVQAQAAEIQQMQREQMHFMQQQEQQRSHSQLQTFAFPESQYALPSNHPQIVAESAGQRQTPQQWNLQYPSQQLSPSQASTSLPHYQPQSQSHPGPHAHPQPQHRSRSQLQQHLQSHRQQLPPQRTQSRSQQIPQQRVQHRRPSGQNAATPHSLSYVASHSSAGPGQSVPATAGVMNANNIGAWNIEQWAIAQYDAQPPMLRQLIPPLGWQAPQALPQPDLTAIHQAYLRSPTLTIKDEAAGEASPQPRYYQMIRDFAITPIVMSRHTRLFRTSFSIPEMLMPRLARDNFKDCSAANPAGKLSLSPTTLRIRMRCIPLKPDIMNIKPQDWIVADCAWPAHLFIEINKKPVEFRRKTHHGKDLPIDITRVLRTVPEVPQQVEIASLSPGVGIENPNYGFAVEIIETLSHPHIMRVVLEQRTAAKETIDNINKALTGSLDDDDIALVTSDISIDLNDPFTAKIFDIPVRGVHCSHRECFDLETFLNTRQRKPRSASNEPCMVDVWKCPLCGKDARPSSLKVDEFLVGVREKLAADGGLDAKAILVEMNGQWKIKPEVLNGKRSNDDDSDDDDDRPRKRMLSDNGSVNAINVKRQIEVISLDDD